MDFVSRLVIEEGLMAQEDLDAAAAEFARQTRLPTMAEYLLSRSLVEEAPLIEAMAKRLGLECITNAGALTPDPELLELIPLDFCQKQRLLPLRIEKGRVVVACADPLDVHPLDDLKNFVEREVQPVVAAASKILDALDLVLDHRDMSEVVEEVREEQATVDADTFVEGEDIRDLAQKTPIVKLLNSYLFGAMQARASDIHIEPYEHTVKVRYRIDGRLCDCKPTPKSLQAPLVSRIKILAGLDIAEDRLPQDGRMTISAGKRQMDLRVSTLPVAYGERVVMRLLDKSQEDFGLQELGFSDRDLGIFSELIQAPFGIILVTGPTGSGKSTTLYSALCQIRSPERNIITVEDPIENRIAEISQIQVKPDIGLTFAAGLRSILRQDPDVIMVGEIRDEETAEIAVHSSLTGHLVFSTLHTNDSAGAVTRLIDMGVEPYLISSSLLGIQAQRLVRRICPNCLTARPVTEEEHSKGITFDTTHYGTGCDACRGTGYFERIGIFEILVIDDNVRPMITKRTPSGVIKADCIRRGMITLRQDGLRKVEAKVTTLEEVLGITQVDEVAAS